MSVASMVMTDMIYWIVSVISISIAFLTDYWIGFAYLNSVLILYLLYLAIVRIPSNLNWSDNLYGSVLNRIFVFQVFSIISYSISYAESEVMKDKFSTFWDALYFSATTWTTLGYGDISPAGNVRLLTSIQALTGLSTLPVLASVIWLYCEKRIRNKSFDAENKENLIVTLDDAFGGFVEVENDKTKAEQSKRDEIKLLSCSCSTPNPHIIKFYDVIGRWTPLANFVVKCSNCGEFSKPSKNAYMAAWLWNNKKHKKTSK